MVLYRCFPLESIHYYCDRCFLCVQLEALLQSDPVTGSTGSGSSGSSGPSDADQSLREKQIQNLFETALTLRTDICSALTHSVSTFTAGLYRSTTLGYFRIYSFFNLLLLPLKGFTALIFSFSFLMSSCRRSETSTNDVMPVILILLSIRDP